MHNIPHCVARHINADPSIYIGKTLSGKAIPPAVSDALWAIHPDPPPKLNDIDPQAWLAETASRILDYKITRIDNLLPWRTAS